MLKAIFFFTMTALLLSCQHTNSQTKKTSSQKVGGPCEGCEAIYESKIPFEALNEVDTLPFFGKKGAKLVISGTVFEADGKTPAPDVVLYIYHTDPSGRYYMTGNETGWGKRHGALRGWVKTNTKGEYKFYTLRPASYPNDGPPAHIHVTIKEPGKNEYWIDDFHFDDDPVLKAHPGSFQNRGGNGVLTLKKKDDTYYGQRNIYLGMNIPGYPARDVIQSGLKVGENCPAFDPFHLSGADINSKACPMCKYGYGQGLMVWFNHDNLDGMKRFTQVLEREMKSRGEKKLRVFLVYMNPTYKTSTEREEALLKEKIKKWCTDQALQKVAVVWVPSPVDEETSSAYKINPKVDNTIFVYKKRKVAAKWVNMNYSDDSAKKLLDVLGG